MANYVKTGLITARRPDMDVSLVVGVASRVAPERSFCFLSAVYELVLQMIARYFAFGHKTPEQRYVQVCVEAELCRSGPVGPDPANIPIPPTGSGPKRRAAFAGADAQQVG